MARYIDADKMIADTEAMRAVSEAITIDGIVKYLNEHATADVQEVKHGYWSQSKKTAFSEECSVCGCTVEHNDGVVIRYPRCPFCGAKMDGKENE